MVQSINLLFYSGILNHPFAIMLNIKHIYSFQLAQLCRKRLLSVTEAHNNNFNHGKCFMCHNYWMFYYSLCQ